MKRSLPLLSLLALLPASLPAGEVSSITQYGITWNFAEPVSAGQFVSGDWWVVGPVEVVSVSPEPGPAEEAAGGTVKSRFGATGLTNDPRMRNGSVVFPPRNPGAPASTFTHQGWDSRSASYAPELTVTFPITLQPGDRLLSSISATETNDKGAPVVPSMMGEIDLFYEKGPKTVRALETVAVLTCLAEEPPADAFRPPYNAAVNTLYRASDIQWDTLLQLTPVESAWDWDRLGRAWERPWFDIPSGWLFQLLAPGANQPAYGREINRLSGITSLMLLLDYPREVKEPVLHDYLQYGIDLHGQAVEGRNWFSDGGHWQGRKWPILFASIVLDAPEIREFPEMDLSDSSGRKRIRASEAVPAPTTVFQEDLDTYYGRGADGQDVLWQMVWHTGPIQPHQEKPRDQWDQKDKKAEGYRLINSSTYLGPALAAQLMEAKAIWNHDAFFDYVDYWMSDAETYQFPKWWPKGRKTIDPFLHDMWARYRTQVPEQPGGETQVKLVWDMETGQAYFVENPKP